MFGILLNHFDSHLFQQAVNFFSTVLELDNKGIPIYVKCVKRIGKSTMGTCAPIFDDEKVVGINIVIKNNATAIGMIEALAHEMIHAKQWINGDISIDIQWKYLFYIIPYPVVKKLFRGRDVTKLKYYDQPAEIEAHVFQKQLTLEFLRYHENQIKSTTMTDLLVIKTDSISSCNNEEK